MLEDEKLEVLINHKWLLKKYLLPFKFFDLMVLLKLFSSLMVAINIIFRMVSFVSLV